MELGLIFFRMLLVLGAVCALAYASLRWGLRRFAPTKPAATGLLSIEDRIHLSPKRQLLIVRVGKDRILIGSSEAGLQRLHQIHEFEYQE